jgi:hypothetical protein
MVTVLRTGLVVVAPLVALVGLVGDEVLHLLLGAAVDAREADETIRTFLALTGLVVAQVANPVPITAVFAASRYGGVVVISAIAAGVHLLLTAAAISTGRLEAIGLAASVSGLCSLALLVGLVFGRRAGAALVALAREAGVVVALALLAFGGAAALAGGLVGSAGALVLGGAAFAGLVRRFLAPEWRLLGRLVPRGRGCSRAAAPR